MTLCRQECRLNGKNLLIWALSVGLLCFACIVLYGSIQESMEEMGAIFSELGAFSEALGMDKVNIGTLSGYYAAEIAIMFSLGGAMFAAITGANMVAKEEEGHTSEFLNTLPLGRVRILAEKFAALVLLLVAFQTICILLMLLGFACMGEGPGWSDFVRYHAAGFLMQLEIGSLCFLWSACTVRKPVGPALGMAILLYLTDMMCRIVPALENAKYVTPFYFSNAADIFSEGTVNLPMVYISIAITAAAAVLSAVVYHKRDLAA